MGWSFVFPGLTLVPEALKLRLVLFTRLRLGGPLFRKFLVLLSAAFCVFAPSSFAQTNSAAVLDGNETLFAVVTAINSCGYDADLNVSKPVRIEIRNEIAAALEASEGAKAAQEGMCEFYDSHKDPDPARTLAKFISLALFLGPPPQFTAKAKEADTPPDAAALLPFAPLLQTFY